VNLRLQLTNNPPYLDEKKSGKFPTFLALSDTISSSCFGIYI